MFNMWMWNTCIIVIAPVEICTESEVLSKFTFMLFAMTGV